MPPLRRRVAGLVLALLLSIAFASVASAHATLVDASPANDETVLDAPAEVVLRFDEPVDADRDGAVRVLDPRGEEAQRGRPLQADGGREVTQRVDADARGTYTVSYRVLSDDGHVVGGSYVFHVGERTSASGSTEPDQDTVVQVAGILGRALAFGGALLAVGALVLARVVDRTPWPPRWLWIGAATSALVGSALSSVALAAELAGTSLAGGVGALGDLASASGGATGPLARTAVAAILLVATLVPERNTAETGGREDGTVGAIRGAGASVAAVLLLVMPAFAGHASVTSSLAVGADAAHLLGASVWVGALAALVATWRSDGDRLRRYSTLALWSALVVVATGTLGAWFELDALSELTSSAWGRTLLVKVGLVAAVLFFGWIHRRWLADASLDVAPMLRSLRVEVVLVVGVVVATAVLVGTRPPAERTAAADDVVESVRQAGEVTVRLQVDPARSGANEVHLYFLSIDGSLRDVDAAELRVSSEGIEPRRVPLTMLSPSHAAATAVELTQGTWSFEVAVVTAEASPSTTFEVSIR